MLAASQQEYLDNLKKSRDADSQECDEPPQSQAGTEPAPSGAPTPDATADDLRPATASSGANHS